MAVPLLKLDLAPPSNLWRLNHALLSWSALAAGGLLLAGSLGLIWRATTFAAAEGRKTVTLVAKTSLSAQSQRQVLSELRNVDVAKELPRWRLAEKIFTERSLPWSRLTAELERSLVVDVRLKSVQRTRSTDMKVQLKLKGEARTRQAEAAFMESLQKNSFFEQVYLEREAERQGGGVDFDYTLAAQTLPPPYLPLPKQPKFGPVKPAVPLAKPAPAQPLRPAPVKPAAPAPAPVQRPPAPPVQRTPPSGAPPSFPDDPHGRPRRRREQGPEGSQPSANASPTPREGRS